jgi:hypothetical protein
MIYRADAPIRPSLKTSSLQVNDWLADFFFSLWRTGCTGLIMQGSNKLFTSELIL